MPEQPSNLGRRPVRSAHLRFGLALVLVFAVAVGACGKGGDDEEESGVKGGKLEIGAALSLTGSLAKEGALTKQG